MFAPSETAATATRRPGRRIDAVAAQRSTPSARTPSGRTPTVRRPQRPTPARTTVRAGRYARSSGLPGLAAEGGSTYATSTGQPADAADAASDGATTDAVGEELARLSVAIGELLPRIPDEAPSAQVDAWFAALKRLDGASSAIRARLIDCARRSRTPEDGGHAGTPSYLREHLGLSGREASKQDALARDLRELPRTAAALAAGEIGPEQAGAIGQASRRGLLGGPDETEEQLLPIARDRSSDALRRHIRDEEHRADRDSLKKQERRQQALRSASLNRRGDGMWELYARLPSEPGEQLAIALAAFRTPDAPDTPMAERRTTDKRTADALSDLVRATLQAGAPITGGVRPQLNVTIPIELLAPGADGAGTTDHGGVLSGEAVQRLSCDADVRWILTRGSTEVLDIGRTSHRWTTAQRRALVVRDGGCRGPGCDRPPAWCDAHHVRWWSQDGPTSLDNGLLLCRRHHRLVHDDGWSLEHDAKTGRARFTSPTGRVETTWPHRGTPESSPPGGPPDAPDPDKAGIPEALSLLDPDDLDHGADPAPTRPGAPAAGRAPP